MKVYINKPKNSWISPYEIIEKIVFWREIDYDEPLVNKFRVVLDPFCDALYSFRKFFERDIKYIKIDPWDVWSMDSTLSPIILPMLKELKRVKHGAPYVFDEDVPPKLRANRVIKYKGNVDPDLHKIDDDVDKKFFKRFDYILDEMIWTFETLSNWDHDDKFYKKVKPHTYKIDRVGLKKHNERIDNGLRLFGKYYRTLWD